MKTINLLGDSQREQWHTVVNLLRNLGGDMTREGRSALCDELDRYIDAMEDANENGNLQDENNNLYTLLRTENVDDLAGVYAYVRTYKSIESAQKVMRDEYVELLKKWNMWDGRLNYGRNDPPFIDYTSAYIEKNKSEDISWLIEEVKPRN